MFGVRKMDPEKVGFGVVVGGSRSLMDVLLTLCGSSELIPGL